MRQETESERRSSGSVNVFEQILDRESELLKGVEEARQHAQQRVTDAQGSVQQISADIEAKARIQAQVEANSIKSQTQEEVERLRALHAKERTVLQEELERNVDRAVDFVIDMVIGVEQGGDSDAG